MRIKILGLPTLLEVGELPEELVDIALMEISSEMGAAGVIARDLAGDDLTDEKKQRALDRIREFGRLQRHIAIKSIQEVEVDGGWQDVELTLDDLDALPEDDLAMVAEIVQRLRVMDAKGVRIGVEPLDRWATFRQAHGCPDEGCESCEEVIRALSSSDVGSV